MRAAAAPESSTTAFLAAITTADLDAATCCFAKDACLVTPDSTAIRGREEIRSILAQLISRRSQIEVLSRSLLVAGEVAMGSERWRISSVGVEGEAFRQTSDSKLVLRYLEGSWKLAIVAPWGLH